MMFSSPKQLADQLLVAHYVIDPTILPVIYLAEQLAPPIDYITETLHAPEALGGVVIAILVATPEAIGAVRAALANQMQRSVNIFLGSVLSTIGLTVPAMLAVSSWTHHPLVLGVEHANMVILLLPCCLPCRNARDAGEVEYVDRVGFHRQRYG